MSKFASKGYYLLPSKIVGLFLFLIGGSVMFAQLPTATILGVVKDSSGAVMPEAALTARNLETGQSRTAVSASDGSYRFLALPVGSYEVRVEHPGFGSRLRSGLSLSVAQEAVVNFTLDVGAIEQTVSVTADAPLVNTTSGTLGGLVDERKVSDLPLNGRNFIDLTLLQTGIQQHRNLGTGVSSAVGTWFSSNGATLRSNNFLLDGAILQNVIGSTSSSVSGTTLGVEGIREWRVVSNSFPAEYGMTMGSQVVIVSKNGTNAYHGTLFEFLRNSALDARNFFDRQTSSNPQRLPAFTRNNFGGSFGGPIQKDRLFFHAVYEGVRERLGRTLVSNTIPASAKVDGGVVPQIDPVIKPLLTLFPDPNLPNNQFTFPFRQRIREDYGQARVDQTLSSDDTLFGRYTIHDTDQVRPLSFPQFRSVEGSRNQYATISENHIFSPVLLNTFRFSYSRTVSIFESPSGISGTQSSFVPGKEIGNISIGGVTPLGPNLVTPQNFTQNIFTWSDDLFYTRGSHSWKFGALANRYQQFLLGSTFNRGQINFSDPTSFLLARPTSYFAITPGSILDRTYHYTTLGFYAQDDWRVRPNFTLNLGLRYEFSTVPDEVRGRGAALRDIQRDAATTLGKPFENPSLRNFSPRFGFAWDIRGDGKTALRGGFGLLYDIATFGSALAGGTTATPPFSSRSTVIRPPRLTLPLAFPPEALGRSLRIVDFQIEQPYLLQYNLTVERQLPWSTSVTLTYAGSRGINLIQTTEGNPTVPEIFPDGRKFFRGNEPRTNPNFDTIELKTAGSSSWYNSFQFGLAKRLSHGFQFQSSYTFSKSLDLTQGQLGFEDNASNSFASDPNNLSLDKGLASFDVAHNWRFNAIYRLPELTPSGGALGNLLNGWWTSGILSVQSGFPFTPGLQANRSRSGVNGGSAGIDRPDLVPGRTNDNIILGGPDRYFDPSAFTIQPAGFLGTAGRNILRGPGFATLDFSVAKDTLVGFLGESGKLEFRAEFFNLLNRANFTTPGLGLFGGNNAAIVFAGGSDVETPLPTAGRITSTASTSRQIQFALKLLF